MFISYLQLEDDFSRSPSRIGLRKMPSIRETLREMGVSVEQVLTELEQKSTDDTNNGTAPTPLTNYLDVRHFLRKPIFMNVMSQTGSGKSRCLRPLGWLF